MEDRDSPAEAALLARIAELEESERRLRLGADHARRHLTLLAQGSRALVAGFDDPAAALRTLAEAIVPSFAEWCAIDTIEDGRITRRATAHADPGLGARLAALLVEHPNWAAPVRRVMATGQSELVWDVSGRIPQPNPPIHPGDSDHLALARALSLESCAIVPIRIQGLSVGAIVCATAPGRRGYRPSDVAAVEELAVRTATTLERISLYQETERAAREAATRAGQLRRLTDAARAIQPQRTDRDVMAVVVDQARRVLAARQVAVVVEGTRTSLRMGSGPGGAWAEEDDRLLALADGPGSGSRALAVPLNDRSGTPVGLLAVGGKESGDFTGDDEAILVSLAQMASVAVANANLYESVRSGEEHLLALVEAAPLAILDFTLEGAVRRFNSAAQQLLGRPAAPDAATRITFHPDTAAVLRRLVTDTAAAGPITDLEAVAWRADGSEVPLSLAGAPLTDAKRTLTGVMVLAADVTARRRLEEQLVRARRIEAVGQMAGGVAHDFNNLLTVILGHATLLDASLEEDDIRRRDVEAISAAAERAAGITSQLLTISRGDLVSSEIFDIRARLKRLSATLRSFLPSSVELVMSLASGEHLVRMSPAQFDQVILNLAVNARDSMGEKGTLTLRLVTAPEAVSVQIMDTGKGMDGATVERCFEPFFTTKGGLRGTGLGLATVHSVVTGAGGDVTVTSAPGAGTTFRVRLPRAVGEATEAETPDRSGGRVRGTEQILLVEDEDGLRRLCVEVLRSAGYIVTAAADGQVAMDLLTTGARPDLVVTDVVMPRVGGMELARHLAEDQPLLPILFMTGYVDAGSRRGLEGADVLTKPFLVDELVEKVREVLDRAGEGAAQGSKG